MDLANVESLDASFTGLYRTDDDGMTHKVPDLDYALMKTGTTWTDSAVLWPPASTPLEKTLPVLWPASSMNLGGT